MPIVVINVGEKESLAYRSSKHVLPTPKKYTIILSQLKNFISVVYIFTYHYRLSLEALFAYQKDCLYQPSLISIYNQEIIKPRNFQA